MHLVRRHLPAFRTDQHRPYAMLRLAGAVYGRTLLHRGSRLRWKDALRLRS